MSTGDYLGGNAEVEEADERRAMERILVLIRALAPLDRQMMLLYLQAWTRRPLATSQG